MRLKELTVQGYKSFATKTRFEFPPGVTAIVGPNGSGKSNIADAIRWALGEQRTTQLRARKTDDMIFAGTEKRARAGMAEVTLVLDNSDGWLPIEFGEVEVSRRAHRDGTNEYAINGSSVRLKDVTDLLGGRLGQSTYTVIGQGLVDSALTLRPEDRRALIDEAAGIVPLQRRRDAARRRLEETDVNLTRVKDVLAEITPRLKRMERLAERAERHDELAASLVSDLEQWYGFHWRRARAEADAAREAVERLTLEAERTRAAVAEREAALRAEDAELETRSGALATQRAERDRLAVLAAAAHESASVAQARLDALESAIVENAARAAEDAAQGAGLAERLAAATALAAEAAAAAAEADAAWAAARERLAGAESQRRALAEVWESAHRAALDASARADDARNRVADLERVIAAAGVDASAQEKALAERAVAVQEANAAAEASAAEALEMERRTAAAELALAEAEAAREGAAEQLRVARDAHAEASARKGALASRARSLAAQIAASGDGESKPWVSGTSHGTGQLAQLLEVESGWEQAAAVALGNLLSGVIVENESALRRALADVAHDFEGQVTLIASSAAPGPGWEPAANEKRATDLVRSNEARSAVERLLANVAFVEDVDAAFAAVRRNGGPAAAATKNGRMVLATGVAIAGAPLREVLALERERRAIPELIKTAETDESACATRVDEAHAQLQTAEEVLVTALRERTALDAKGREAATAAANARAAADRMQAEVEWVAAASARQLAEADGARVRAAELASSLADLGRLADEARAAEAEARRTLEGCDTTGLIQETDQATELARNAAALAATRRAEADAIQAQIAAMDHALAARSQRLGTVAEERSRLEADVARLQDEAVLRAAELKALDDALSPDEEELREASRRTREETLALDGLRRTTQAAEAALVEARLASARADSQLERVLEHLAADADLLPAAASYAAAAGAHEPQLPHVEALGEGMEGRITRVRAQLRDLGAIDAEALATYRETAEHHQLLTEQRADLLAAEGDVKTAIEELEADMATRFGRTFETVAREFHNSFPALFGGGEARLELDPETGGIEIMARPPGKRAQPLALMSGGERSLTAVALVFALLRASETPFVVLDEVDAALDEANVDRFRAALEELARATQVVIVTHNRGTVQTASTVYGVSMGEDGASQTLSVRVDSVARA